MAMCVRKQLEEKLSSNIFRDKAGKRDLSAVYQNISLLKEAVAYLAEPYRGKVNLVAVPESMGGLILGTLLADALGVGLLPMHIKETYHLEDEQALRASYIDHNNKVRTLQIHKDALPENSIVLLADDWIGTAATMQACRTIVEEGSSNIAGIVSIGIDGNSATDKMISSGLSRSILVRI